MKPPECIGCPYYNNRGPVWGRGSPNAKLVTIAQNPWEQEYAYTDEMGRGMPLAGASGRVYNRNAELAGINREREFTTNIVKCLVPPGERLHPGAVRQCRVHLDRELALLPRAQTILTLGQEAFNYLTGKELSIVHTRGKWNSERESKATTHNPLGWLRGCPIPVVLGQRAFTIIPSMHPAYVMRTGFRDAPILEVDMRKAKRWAEGGGITYEPQITSINTSHDARECARYVLSKGNVGLDIETHTKSQFDEEEVVFQGAADKIEVVGLATGFGECFEIPGHLLEHISILFNQQATGQFLTVFTFNGGYDLGNIAAHLSIGLPQLLNRIQHVDLMLALNCLYTDCSPKDLAMAISLFTDMPYTKNLARTNPPLYNASDSIGALWGGQVALQQIEDVPAYART